MKYPYRVFKAEYEGKAFWVAKSDSLKGCVGQGDSLEEALNELEENEVAWIETAKEFGIAIPDIAVEQVNEYSGKLTLRISPSEHEKAAKYAKREGVSLNQYIHDAVVAKNAEHRLSGYITSQMKDTIGLINSVIMSGKTAFEDTSRIEIAGIQTPNRCYLFS